MIIYFLPVGSLLSRKIPNGRYLYKGGFEISTLEVNFVGKTLVHAWRLKLISQLFRRFSPAERTQAKSKSLHVTVLSKR